MVSERTWYRAASAGDAPPETNSSASVATDAERSPPGMCIPSRTGSEIRRRGDCAQPGVVLVGYRSRRIRRTLIIASRTMLPDIFDFPRVRSGKTMGTSTMRKPFR